MINYFYNSWLWASEKSELTINKIQSYTRKPCCGYNYFQTISETTYRHTQWRIYRGEGDPGVLDPIQIKNKIIIKLDKFTCSLV